MRPVPVIRRRLLAGATALLALAAAVVAAVATTPSPVHAHSADGDLTVLRAEQVAPGELQVEVGLVYADDGHLAEEATVTATPTSPAGTEQAAVPLPRISGGRYGGPVPVDAPGAWSLAITAADPAATATVEVAVDPTGPTTTAPTTTSPTATSTSSPPTTTAEDPGTDEVTTTAASDDGESSSSTPIVVAVVVALVVLGAAVAIAVRRRQAGGRG